MSLIKCPKCGEMFSDSYKTCPFCEEDEAYYGGRVKKSRGRRTQEDRKRRAPSILGPVVVVVLVLLAALVVLAVRAMRASSGRAICLAAAGRCCHCRPLR